LLAWGGTAVVIGVIAAIVVIVGVNESGAEPANAAIDCTVSDSGGATALTVKGKVTEKEADEGCDGIAGKLSGGGRYWRVGLPPVPEDNPELVCAFHAPEGRIGTAIVETDPGSFSGSATAICGQFAHEGWTQFIQGGVIGPWQHEYQAQQEAEEAAEQVEQEVFEDEQLELEEVEEAVHACEERAELREEAEIEAIQVETEGLVAAAASESEEFRLEEEGWEAEEQAWAEGEEADTRCQENGGAEAEGGTEFR
jgi:hypothetical protein